MASATAVGRIEHLPGIGQVCDVGTIGADRSNEVLSSGLGLRRKIVLRFGSLS